MNTGSTTKANILVVDDTVENLQLLTSMLKDQGYEARPVPSGKLALQATVNDPPDLILLDIDMPLMNGYEVCERLKAHDETKNIPVIFISAMDETMDKVKAFDVGGVDYVTKPFQLEEVMARVKTHLALRRSQMDLEESYGKLRALEQLRDDLVHMIVHDMKSPLFVLIANIEIVKEALASQLESDTLRQIDTSMAAGAELKNMINELLDVSRLEKGQMPVEREECDLCKEITDAIESIKGMARDREIQIDASGCVKVRCDRKMVRRMVENLVSNGIKHTATDRPIRVLVTKRKDRALISVRDEGSGIPEEFKERIFEKFGTLEARRDEKYHSTGLGLAFCKLAVEAHGGQIGVDSVDGQGSTFWFTLPAS